MAKVWFSRWPPVGHKIGQSKKSVGVLPKGILTPSFIEIAPAVTKRALLTDDDGRHIIAIAHWMWAKNEAPFDDPHPEEDFDNKTSCLFVDEPQGHALITGLAKVWKKVQKTGPGD
jgi:hypothetical protein